MCGVYDKTITDQINSSNEAKITQYISEHMSVNMLKYLIVTDVYTAACAASCVDEWKDNPSAIISLTFDTIEENGYGGYNLNYTISGYQPEGMNMNGFGYSMGFNGVYTCNLHYGAYTASNITFGNNKYTMYTSFFGNSSYIDTVRVLYGRHITCNDGSRDIEMTNFCNSAFGSGFWTFERNTPNILDQFTEIKTYHTWENFILSAFPNLKSDSNTNVGLAVGLGVGLGVPAVGGIAFGTYYGIKKRKNKK